MFKDPSYIFDILCTVVWLVLAIRYARKGFLAGVVQLTGNLISLFGARQFSGWAAGQVFERFFAGSFRDQIAASISADGAVSLSGIAARYAGFLPESFRASIVEACERSISAVLNDNAVLLADVIVQKVLAPLLTPVISLVLFFVAFALLRMLVSLLVTVLGLVNKLPVIGTVNRGLGYTVGALASLVDIYLVLCVVWAIIVITGGNLTVLNDTVMSSSLYYKAFNLFNPFQNTGGTCRRNYGLHSMPKASGHHLRPADGERPDEKRGVLPALCPRAAHQAGGGSDEAVRHVGSGSR